MMGFPADASIAALPSTRCAAPRACSFVASLLALHSAKRGNVFRGAKLSLGLAKGLFMLSLVGLMGCSRRAGNTPGFDIPENPLYFDSVKDIFRWQQIV